MKNYSNVAFSEFTMIINPGRVSAPAPVPAAARAPAGGVSSSSHGFGHALRQASFFAGLLVRYCFLGLGFSVLIPINAVLFLLCTHRSVILVKRIKTCPSANEMLMILFMHIFVMLFDFIATFGVSYLCWYIILLTLYRLPSTVTELWNFVPQRRDRLTNELLFSYIPVKHLLLTIKDVAVVGFCGFAILVTVHRVRHLLNSLKPLKYQDWMKGDHINIFISEFKSIGMYQRHEDKIINQIISEV